MLCMGGFAVIRDRQHREHVRARLLDAAGRDSVHRSRCRIRRRKGDVRTITADQPGKVCCRDPGGRVNRTAYNHISTLDSKTFSGVCLFVRNRIDIALTRKISVNRNPDRVLIRCDQPGRGDSSRRRAVPRYTCDLGRRVNVIPGIRVYLCIQQGNDFRTSTQQPYTPLNKSGVPLSSFSSAR